MSPIETEKPAAQEPAITPELLRDHGVTPEEYQRIQQSLGRTPTLTELGIFSVMWSEHCSYKSSRLHLKRLPTRSKRVVQGPGENAGVIDIGKAPKSASRAFILGSARAALISLLSLSMISVGVLLGAPIPYQPLAS